MPDAGTKKTDKEIKKVEQRLQEVYAEAEKDIENKLTTFTDKFQVKNQIKLDKLKKGEITQEEYNNWISGQVFQKKQWENKRDQIVNTIHNTNQIATKMVNNEMYGIFAFNSNYQAYQIEKGFGANFGFGLYDTSTVKNLVKNDPQILPKWKIHEKKDYIWNRKKVNNAITQGIIQGERLDQIVKRISTGLCSQNENLMKTFARTGMTQAQNAGRYQRQMEAKKLGIDMVKEWMSTLDGRTRDSHRHMDGEKVDIGDDVKFSNGLRYPGDPEGPAREVYGCRCTLVADLVDYPSDEYERRDNINGMTMRNMTYDEWEKVKTAEKRTGITTFLPTPTKFKKDFDVAKATIIKNAWRVDDTYTVEDYKHKKLFELCGGSTVAVTDEGDIVSVCKNAVGGDRGSDLLKIAVANGGDRLDAFGEDLYHFYTKNGFEPVSWTPFNEEYAPHDWVKGRDKPEPVIFYMYTGQTTSTSYSDFLSSISPCVGEDGYGDAMVIRNKLIDSKK